MMIGIAEGTTWRFEVVEHLDGYIVQSRDLSTSVLDGSEQRLFRTAIAALAYADLSAALERTAAARVEGNPAPDLVALSEKRNSVFREISERLLDRGCEPQILVSQHQGHKGPRRLH
jgi:hypothetical protein